MEATKCLYDRWFDNEVLNMNLFTLALFKAFQLADGTNKKRILVGWPELFAGSQNI